MRGLVASIDIQALLTPIPGDQPCGSDLRDDNPARSSYYEMRDLRNDARTEERRAEAPRPDVTPVDPAPKWRELAALAATVIQASAKDLEVVAWLIEAEVRARGLAAVTEGARLVQGLVEQFWDGLYPLPDEDGISTRVAPLTGLNGQGGDGTLVFPLMRLPIFRRADGTWLALWEWRLSEAGRLPDAPSHEALLKEVAAPAGHRQFAALREQADAACAAWTAASAALEAAAGRDRPPMARIRDILLGIQALANAHGGPSGDAASETTIVVAGTDGSVAAATYGSSMPLHPATGDAMTREDALRLLAEVAAFFRRTEPHSALSYTLEDAVRRARMNLLDLLAEILPDSDQREGMLLRLGVRPPPAAPEEN